MIEIHDNFLNKKDFDKLLEAFTQNNTPFYLQKSIIEYPKPDNHVQMFHILYENNIKSYLFDLIKPLIDKLKIKKLFKCKINLLLRTDNIVEHGYHIDFIKKPKDLYTSILYLNTNNGYTKFKKGVIVNSLRNRLIKFPNEKEHTGSTNNCEEPYRLVLNINYTL